MKRSKILSAILSYFFVRNQKTMLRLSRLTHKSKKPQPLRRPKPKGFTTGLEQKKLEMSKQNEKQTDLTMPKIRHHDPFVNEMKSDIGYDKFKKNFWSAGNCTTGALGVKALSGYTFNDSISNFFHSKNSNVELDPKGFQKKPLKCEILDVTSKSSGLVACGNGFTLITGKDSNIKQSSGDPNFYKGLLAGCGINTSSQIGTHIMDDREKELAKDMYEQEEGTDNKLKRNKSDERNPFQLPKISENQGELQYLYSFSKLTRQDAPKQGPVTRISAGRQHSAFVQEIQNGSNESVVTLLGSNRLGQLGDKNENLTCNILNSTDHFNGEYIVDVVCGLDHTLFLTIDKEFSNLLYSEAFLQKIKFETEKIPKRPKNMKNDISVSNWNYKHLAAINIYNLGQEKRAKFFESKESIHMQIDDKKWYNYLTIKKNHPENERYQEFLPKGPKSEIHKLVPNNKSIFNVYSTGWSPDGQTGQNTYEKIQTPSKMNYFSENGINIVKIATKGDFCLALDNFGSIYGWGNNEYDQLSFGLENLNQENANEALPQQINHPILLLKGSKESYATDISCTSTTGFYIDQSGKVFSWGYGLTLGQGPHIISSKTPKEIPLPLFGISEQLFGLDPVTQKLPKIKSINSGIEHVVAVTNEGLAYGWGKNFDGRLGNNTRRDFSYPFPIVLPEVCVGAKCGMDHTVFVTDHVT